MACTNYNAMDEYISREAVVRYLKGYSEKELNGNHNFGMITSSVLDKAERALSEMPAADVQPVKHGHWIEHPDDIFPLENTIECSVCGEQENVNIHNDNFCPNCGCKMGGDSE